MNGVEDRAIRIGMPVLQLHRDVFERVHGHIEFQERSSVGFHDVTSEDPGHTRPAKDLRLVLEFRDTSVEHPLKKVQDA